jgi:hypothetical protein
LFLFFKKIKYVGTPTDILLPEKRALLSVIKVIVNNEQLTLKLDQMNHKLMNNEKDMHDQSMNDRNEIDRLVNELNVMKRKLNDQIASNKIQNEKHIQMEKESKEFNIILSIKLLLIFLIKNFFHKLLNR